jgi:uncharacterized membrane protein YozB (DUF420 family)
VADWYFGLPLWLSTGLVLAACVAVCVGGHVAARALMLKAAPRQETELAAALMVVIAAFTGIMLAFSAVQVWQDYGDAQSAVVAEAAASSELYRDLTVYGEESRPARQALTVYVRSVVDDEWPRMAKDGATNPKTADALVEVFKAMAAIEPSSARKTVIYGEAFKRLNEVVEHRRARLIASQKALPALFWLVVLIGSAIIVGYTVVWPATPMNLLLVAGLGVSLGLIFVFILDVERPFTGRVSVNPNEMRRLLPLFEKLEAR